MVTCSHQFKKPVKILLLLLVSVVVLEIAVSGSGLGSTANGQEKESAIGIDSYRTDATIADIMESIVMPSADALWNAVVIYSSEDGLVEEQPETDEDWAKLRWSAVNLAEATNLLLMPGRRVDLPGVVSEAPDYELGPDQIQALIGNQRTAWAAHALVLHETAMQTIKVIEAHDVNGLTEIGGAIDEACEGCHQQFWYPKQ